jgi:cell division protein YceG involved in septum cleavage
MGGDHMDQLGKGFEKQDIEKRIELLEKKLLAMAEKILEGQKISRESDLERNTVSVGEPSKEAAKAQAITKYLQLSKEEIKNEFELKKDLAHRYEGMLWSDNVTLDKKIKITEKLIKTYSKMDVLLDLAKSKWDMDLEERTFSNSFAYPKNAPDAESKKPNEGKGKEKAILAPLCYERSL